MVVLRSVALTSFILLCGAILAQPVGGQTAPAPGSMFLAATPVTIGATVPCDSAVYTLGTAVPAPGKAYTARSFGGTACTTSMDLVVPKGFAATSPITIRAVFGCDQRAASAGVSGATTSVRFNILHGTKQIGASINLVGSNTCTPGTPLVFQANADLKGEAFAAGDLLRVNVIPFYTTPGAGDPGKSLHLAVGGVDPTLVTIPELASGGAVVTGNPPLYQNVTEAQLRVGRENVSALNQREVYNWTAPEGPIVASYEANVTSGSVNVTVLEGNTTLANFTVDASGNQSRTIQNSGTGNWSIRIDYSNFTGSIVLTMGAAPAPAPPTTTSTSSSTTNDDGRTGGFPLRQEKDTPSLPSVLLLLAIVGLGLLVRRRLA